MMENLRKLSGSTDHRMPFNNEESEGYADMKAELWLPDHLLLPSVVSWQLDQKKILYALAHFREIRYADLGEFNIDSGLIDTSAPEPYKPRSAHNSQEASEVLKTYVIPQLLAV